MNALPKLFSDQRKEREENWYDLDDEIFHQIDKLAV